MSTTKSKLINSYILHVFKNMDLTARSAYKTEDTDYIIKLYTEKLNTDVDDRYDTDILMKFFSIKDIDKQEHVKGGKSTIKKQQLLLSDKPEIINNLYNDMENVEIYANLYFMILEIPGMIKKEPYRSWSNKFKNSHNFLYYSDNASHIRSIDIAKRVLSKMEGDEYYF